MGLEARSRQDGTSMPHLGGCKRKAFFHAEACWVLWLMGKVSLPFPAMMRVVKPSAYSCCLSGSETNQASQVRGIWVISGCLAPTLFFELGEHGEELARLIGIAPPLFRAEEEVDRQR